MSRWNVLVILFVLGVSTVIASPASAGGLDRSKNTYNGVSISCTDAIKNLESQDAKDEFYNKTKKKAQFCIGLLNELVNDLKTICDNCSQSDNKSAVSTVKSNVLRATQSALDKAERLKRRAESKQDPTSEIRELLSALREVKDKYRQAWKLHEDRLVQVTKEYQEVRKRWEDETKDDYRPVMAALGNYENAQRKTIELMNKYATSVTEYNTTAKNQQIADQELQKALAEGRPMADLIRLNDRNMVTEKGRITMSEKMNDLSALVSEAAASERKAYDALFKAERIYKTEVEQGAALLKGEMMKKYELCEDFAGEYQRFRL